MYRDWHRSGAERLDPQAADEERGVEARLAKDIILENIYDNMEYYIYIYRERERYEKRKVKAWLADLPAGGWGVCHAAPSRGCSRVSTC